eukprot:g22257.t1
MRRVQEATFLGLYNNFKLLPRSPLQACETEDRHLLVFGQDMINTLEQTNREEKGKKAFCDQELKHTKSTLGEREDGSAIKKGCAGADHGTGRSTPGAIGKLGPRACRSC